MYDIYGSKDNRGIFLCHIPFATSGSSGIGEAEAYLKKTYPTLKWQKGLLLNKR